MINDDTAPLFSGDPNDPTPVSLRQGVVEAWDPDTGENSIQIAGGTLVNLPALTSESASLVAGDVVALLTDGSKWLLVGKVTTPGDPGTVPSWVGDIAALAPLTEMAAVTEGLTVTGATNVTSDPGDGAHIVVNDPAYPGAIAAYSGNPIEVKPGLVESGSSGSNVARLRLSGAEVVALHNPNISLESYDNGDTMATHVADQILIEGGDFTRILGFGSGVMIGSDITPGEFITVTSNAITNADLSSPTNTFPFKGGRTSITTDATGRATITHGMSATPAWVVLTSENTGTYWPSLVTRTSTTFTVQINNKDAGVLVSSAFNIHWFAGLN